MTAFLFPIIRHPQKINFSVGGNKKFPDDYDGELEKIFSAGMVMQAIVKCSAGVLFNRTFAETELIHWDYSG